MEIKELRIGNFIKLHEIITKLEYTDFSFNPLFITPIPLTEEWLLKLGFMSMSSNYIIKAGDYYNSIKKDYVKWIYSYDESAAACYELKEIKYVHQLQNIYFALNDKEI